MFLIHLCEPVAPLVASQPFHQPLKRMRARHNSCRYGAVIDDSPWAWRWASLATWRRRFDGWAILETLNQQVFLGKPGILEGVTVTCNGDIGYLRDVEPDDRELSLSLTDANSILWCQLTPRSSTKYLTGDAREGVCS